jgi:predicted homoserine dehydrogenase-like protein
MTAADSVRVGGLPIGLANRVPLIRDVPTGQPVTWEDVRIDTTSEAYQYRRAMEAAFPAA